MKTTYLTDEPVPTGPLLFLRSIRKVLSRPLWLVTWVLLILLALPVGVIWHTWFRVAVSNRYQTDGVGEAQGASPFAWDDLVYTLTASFRHDHAQGLTDLDTITARLGAALALLAIFLGVFAAGGWLQVILERTHGRSLSRFFYGGARYFGRFLRFFLFSLLLFAAWNWLIYGSHWNHWVLHEWQGVNPGDYKKLEGLDSEMLVRQLGWLQDGVHALGFALLLAWGTFSRTRIALLDSRSVLKAGLLTIFRILAHPIKTLRPLGLLFVVELLIVTVLCGQSMLWLERGLKTQPSFGLVAAMLGTGLFALLWREIIRGARYHAAVKVSQEIVRRPPAQPDPWEAIGGPGGPQYPVTGSDESYVAM